MVVLQSSVTMEPPPSLLAHVAGPNEKSAEDAVVINSLSYAYSGHKPIISDISLTLPEGSRCLLIGANGAGTYLESCCF